MRPIVAQIWIELSRENGVDTMAATLNALLSHVDWWNVCVYLRSLNVRRMRLVEATGL
jgi:hypothetical protein